MTKNKLKTNSQQQQLRATFHGTLANTFGHTQMNSHFESLLAQRSSKCGKSGYPLIDSMFDAFLIFDIPKEKDECSIEI